MVEKRSARSRVLYTSSGVLAGLADLSGVASVFLPIKSVFVVAQGSVPSFFPDFIVQLGSTWAALLMAGSGILFFLLSKLLFQLYRTHYAARMGVNRDIFREIDLLQARFRHPPYLISIAVMVIVPVGLLSPAFLFTGSLVALLVLVIGPQTKLRWTQSSPVTMARWAGKALDVSANAMVVLVALVVAIVAPPKWGLTALLMSIVLWRRLLIVASRFLNPPRKQSMARKRHFSTDLYRPLRNLENFPSVSDDVVEAIRHELLEHQNSATLDLSFPLPFFVVRSECQLTVFRLYRSDQHADATEQLESRSLIPRSAAIRPWAQEILSFGDSRVLRLRYQFQRDAIAREPASNLEVVKVFLRHLSADTLGFLDGNSVLGRKILQDLEAELRRRLDNLLILSRVGVYSDIETEKARSRSMLAVSQIQQLPSYLVPASKLKPGDFLEVKDMPPILLEVPKLEVSFAGLNGMGLSTLSEEAQNHAEIIRAIMLGDTPRLFEK